MATPDKTAKRMSDLYEMMNDGLSRSEFEEAFIAVVDLVKDVRQGINDDIAEFKEELRSFSEKMKEESNTGNLSFKETLQGMVEDTLDTMEQRVLALKDGETPVKGIHYEDGYTPEKGVDYFDGENGNDGSPDTGDDIIAKIHESEALIDISKIAGLEELEQRLGASAGEGGGAGWGAHPLRIENSSNAAIEKVARTIRYKGAGVSVARTKDGVVEVTIGGGAASTPLTPTGAVNGSNTVFTVVSEPSSVVADGITYYDGAGYTYAALTITMTTPPSQYIRYYA